VCGTEEAKSRCFAESGWGGAGDSPGGLKETGSRKGGFENLKFGRGGRNETWGQVWKVEERFGGQGVRRRWNNWKFLWYDGFVGGNN